MTFLVKKAEKHEATAVVAVLNQALAKKNSYGDKTWGNNEFTEKEIRNSIKNGIRYVAIVDDEIVGTFVMTDKDEKVWGIQNEPAYYIHQLATDNLSSGSGVGSKILNWVHKQAKRDLKKFVRLDVPSENQSLNDYYKRHEFKLLKTVQIHSTNKTNLYQKKVV